jgi:hypothetical protein
VLQVASEPIPAGGVWGPCGALKPEPDFVPSRPSDFHGRQAEHGRSTTADTKSVKKAGREQVRVGPDL